MCSWMDSYRTLGRCQSSLPCETPRLPGQWAGWAHLQRTESQLAALRNSFLIKSASGGGTGTQRSPLHPQHLPGLTRIGAWRVWPSPDPLGSNWERKKRGRVSRTGAEGEIPLWLREGFLFPLAPRASDLPAPVKRVPSVMWERGLGSWAFGPGNWT